VLNPEKNIQKHQKKKQPTHSIFNLIDALGASDCQPSENEIRHPLDQIDILYERSVPSRGIYTDVRPETATGVRDLRRHKAAKHQQAAALYCFTCSAPRL